MDGRLDKLQVELDELAVPVAIAGLDPLPVSGPWLRLGDIVKLENPFLVTVVVTIVSSGQLQIAGRVVVALTV